MRPVPFPPPRAEHSRWFLNILCWVFNPSPPPGAPVCSEATPPPCSSCSRGIKTSSCCVHTQPVFVPSPGWEDGQHSWIPSANLCLLLLSSAEGRLEVPVLGVLINRHLGIIKIFHLMKEKCSTPVACF